MIAHRENYWCAKSMLWVLDLSKIYPKFWPRCHLYLYSWISTNWTLYCIKILMVHNDGLEDQAILQLREYLEYRLHRGLSKFDRSIFLSLKPISYFLAFMWLSFVFRNYWSLFQRRSITCPTVLKNLLEDRFPFVQIRY